MDKPEIKRYNAKVGFMGAEKVFSMQEQNFGPWVAYDDYVEAILSAQSQAYIDAARIAEEERLTGVIPSGTTVEEIAIMTAMVDVTAKSISAAILSRKDEVGRN